MTILQSCHTMLTDVQKLESFDVIEETVNRLEEHRLKITEPRKLLIDYIGKIQALDGRFCTLPKVEDIKKDLQKYIETLEGNDKELREAFIVIKSSITEIVNQVKVELDVGYKNILGSIPNQDTVEPHLRLVATIDGCKDYVSDVRKQYVRLKEFGDVRSLSQMDLKEYVTSIDNLQYAVENIPIKEFPENVRKFLEATRKTEGSPYNLLTKDVEEWLKANNMMNKIRIILST